MLANQRTLLGILCIALTLSMPCAVQAVPSGGTEPAAVVNEAPATKDRLQDFIKVQLETLSEQQGYESWKRAGIEVTALGPGTHGWLVLLNVNGRDAGYLIITAGDDGTLTLAEYGRGTVALFNLKTLYAAMLQQELIPRTLSWYAFQNNGKYKFMPVYLSPLQAFWQVTKRDGTILYFEPRTGELLPLHKAQMAAYGRLSVSMPTSAAASSAEPDSLMLASFDPYETLTWIRKAPETVPTFDALEALLRQKRKTVYSWEPFGRTLGYTAAVVGFEVRPGSEPYVLLHHEDSTRAVSFSSLQQSGGFY
ncbi:hypothetical protein [Paenibacillus gansuensis]|uniref:Uncharacterized protein n=1 Tax=Paenibacillus gansuensis TaxID=306542 RepID=A0ABW5PF92_9BACL